MKSFFGFETVSLLHFCSMCLLLLMLLSSIASQSSMSLKTHWTTKVFKDIEIAPDFYHGYEFSKDSKQIRYNINCKGGPCNIYLLRSTEIQNLRSPNIRFIHQHLNTTGERFEYADAPLIEEGLLVVVVNPKQNLDDIYADYELSQSQEAMRAPSQRKFALEIIFWLVLPVLVLGVFLLLFLTMAKCFCCYETATNKGNRYLRGTDGVKVYERFHS